jgi:hypothetical protein
MFVHIFAEMLMCRLLQMSETKNLCRGWENFCLKYLRRGKEQQIVYIYRDKRN